MTPYKVSCIFKEDDNELSQFDKLIENKTITEVLTNIEKEYHKKSEKEQTEMRINNKIESEIILKALE